MISVNHRNRVLDFHPPSLEARTRAGGGREVDHRDEALIVGLLSLVPPGSVAVTPLAGRKAAAANTPSVLVGEQALAAKAETAATWASVAVRPPGVGERAAARRARARIVLGALTAAALAGALLWGCPPVSA